MSLKTYFDMDLRTTVTYTVAAIIMGYVSFTINNTAYATLAALVALAAITLALRVLWKIKEGAKWWLGNGVIVYLFLWLIVWTIFYNTYVLM